MKSIIISSNCSGGGNRYEITSSWKSKWTVLSAYITGRELSTCFIHIVAYMEK